MAPRAPRSRRCPRRRSIPAVSTALLLGSSAGADLGCGKDGPDLVVGQLVSVANYPPVDGIDAFMVAPVTCNLGSAPIPFEAATAAHPVLVQNLYRIESGRFEHLGMSWVFHESTALAANACGCGCDPPGSLAMLGPWCSTTHSAFVSGSQVFLGSRSDVDASTGALVFPFTHGDQGPVGSSVYKRLQVPLVEIDPAEHPGAEYLVETVSVTGSDAGTPFAANNASHRRVLFAGTPEDRTATLSGTTLAGAAAIQGWAEADPSVELSEVVVEGEGRVLIGVRTAQRQDGLWTYEYVLFNLDLDRGVGALALPLPDDASVEQIGFHAAPYHSGEPYSNAPWTASATCELRWSTAPWSTSPDANALRWAEAHTFRFVTSTPPAAGVARLEFFAPGEAAWVEAPLTVPGGGDASSPCGTPAGDLNGDGVVDGADLGLLLGGWGVCPSPPEPCLGDLDGNGDVDGADLGVLLSAWSDR